MIARADISSARSPCQGEAETPLKPQVSMGRSFKPAIHTSNSRQQTFSTSFWCFVFILLPCHSCVQLKGLIRPTAQDCEPQSRIKVPKSSILYTAPNDLNMLVRMAPRNMAVTFQATPSSCLTHIHVLHPPAFHKQLKGSDAEVRVDLALFVPCSTTNTWFLLGSRSTMAGQTCFRRNALCFGHDQSPPTEGFGSPQHLG